MIFDDFPDPLISCRLDRESRTLRIEEWNPATDALFGPVEPFAGKPMRELLVDDRVWRSDSARAGMVRALDEDGRYEFEGPLAIRGLGGDRLVRVRLIRRTAELVLVHAEDVTEREARERASRSRARAQGVADVVAVVAHHLNNALVSALLGVEYSARVDAADASGQQEARDITRAALGRISSTLGTLSSLVHAGLAAGSSATDLAFAARDVVAQRQLPFVVEAPDDPVWVQGPPQAVAALLASALSAIAAIAPSSESIRVSLGVEGDAAVVAIGPLPGQLSPGAVRLLVDGTHRGQVTTSEAAVHLYTAHVLVEQLRGRFDVTGVFDDRRTVRIVLPRLESSVLPEELSVPPVLLIGGDASIASVMRDALGEGVVERVASFQEGLVLLLERPFARVFIDQDVAHQAGEQLARVFGVVGVRRPEDLVTVLVRREPIAFGGIPTLSVPFSARELRDAIASTPRSSSWPP